MDDLRAVGRPAVLLCFVPALFEIAATVALAPWLMGVSVLDAALIGSVLAAVSGGGGAAHAQLMEKAMAPKTHPQMVMAGASVDDVFVIVLFTAFSGMAAGQGYHAARLLAVPSAIGLGILAGMLTGTALSWLFTHFTAVIRARSSSSCRCPLCWWPVRPFPGAIGFSGLLAVMAIGAVLHKKQLVSQRLSAKFSKLWVAAEVLLFVLVGAAVDCALRCRPDCLCCC